MKAAQPTARARKSLANPPRTEGLTTLDRNRASSIADEGGTSAAEVEAQRPPTSTSSDADGTISMPRRPYPGEH